MERIISEQDKIKRAEELLNKRRGTISAKNINRTQEKKQMPFLVKVTIKIITSICLFGAMYFMSQYNLPMIENIREILNYNIDFEQVYSAGKDGWQKFSEWLKEDNSVQEENSEETENMQNEEASETESSEEDIQEESMENETTEEVGIGGSDEEVNLSQDEQDIEYIKNTVSLIKPLEGTVTSGYGKREATEIISENHAGIDIGAVTGTDIVAAMGGTVELVSSYGDYGNHIKITNGEVSTLYAHCSTIVVNQGDYVYQGQKIAEVGSTGRATGPHLHFEIARSGRTVDPAALLDF